MIKWDRVQEAAIAVALWIVAIVMFVALIMVIVLGISELSGLVK